MSEMTVAMPVFSICQTFAILLPEQRQTFATLGGNRHLVTTLRGAPTSQVVSNSCCDGYHTAGCCDNRLPALPYSP